MLREISIMSCLIFLPLIPLLLVAATALKSLREW